MAGLMAGLMIESMVGPNEVAAFLHRHGWGDADRRPMAGDASARRYERLYRAGNKDAGQGLLMLAPPGPMATEFITVAAILDSLGLSAPRILAAEPDLGLALVEDFGDDTYTALLDHGIPPLPLYELAVDSLIHLHRHFSPDGAAARLPVFDRELFLNQTMLFCESYLPTVLDTVDDQAIESFRQAWTAPLEQALTVPNSLLLRDFHAGNLFHLSDRPGVRACGLIDFQDAGVGPVTYDMVSLLQDARRDVPARVTAACLARYTAAFPNLDPGLFEISYNVLAAQRHIRVIAIFARLAGQGKPDYMAYLPRLLALLGQALGHPVLEDLAIWFDRHLNAVIEIGQQPRQ